MLKKTVYDKQIKNNFNECCKNRAWHNWNIPSNMISLLPDVSRSYRRPYTGINNDRVFLENLFNRPRKTNLIPFPDLQNVEVLTTKETYENWIKKDLKNAVEFKDLSNCDKKDGLASYNTKENG